MINKLSQEDAYLKTLFKTVLKKYPYIELPLVYRINKIFKILIESATTELKQILHNGNYFMRYDLTLPFIYSKLTTRAEVGTVCRLAPLSAYRQIQFVQGDIDTRMMQANDSTTVLTDLLAFFKKIPVQVTVRFNHLTKFAQLTGRNMDELKQWQKQVEETGRALNEVYEQRIKQYVVQKYGPLFLSPNIKVDSSIVRGLHMYNGLVYELYYPNCKYAMGAGGEYTVDLLDCAQYTGCSAGITRIAKYIATTIEKVPLLLVAGCNLENTDTAFIDHPFVKVKPVNIALYRVLKQYSKYPLIIIKGPNEKEGHWHIRLYRGTILNKLVVTTDELNLLLSETTSYTSK